jgi:hypothetical protein
LAHETKEVVLQDQPKLCSIYKGELVFLQLLREVFLFIDWLTFLKAPMAQWFTQPVAEMSTIRVLGKEQPVCKADDLTTICELIFWTIWDP